MAIARRPHKSSSWTWLLLLATFYCFWSQAATQIVSALATDSSQGDITPVRDPSMIRQGTTYFVFSTDPRVHPPDRYIPIRCSQDRINWTLCGHVFNAIPAWAKKVVPQADNLWAPDISFFNGIYHLYYSASTPGAQLSGIALATNTTLDSTSPDYKWVDRGAVLTSRPGDDFNAIDPNILVDSRRHVWLTYGSFWSGIKQREIDPVTGMLLTPRQVPASLAFRPDHRVVEGPSLLFHDGFYYLFVSYGRCCNPDLSLDDYREAVGRSASPHGPFLDRQGQPLSRGGGTILLQGNATWVAPGGGSAWLDPESGDAFFVFHSLDAEHHGRATLWVKSIRWTDGWPSLTDHPEALAIGLLCLKKEQQLALMSTDQADAAYCFSAGLQTESKQDLRADDNSSSMNRARLTGSCTITLGHSC